MSIEYTSPRDVVALANDVKLPCVGFGTWQSEPELVSNAVKVAIDAGYRHVDAAAVYKNEPEVGRGIAQSSIARKDLFVTSKVWNTERGYETTKAAFQKTLADLGLDYLDLYLIHWPANAKMYGEDATQVNLDTWRAMTELYKEGKIRAIGVSNFLRHHLEPLMQTEVAPMVNQIELHPNCPQTDAVTYCREHGIVLEAWSPLGTGKLLGNATVGEVAARVGKSPAQVLVRWSMQHGYVPLPKSVTPSRIYENTDVFGFELSADDMSALDGIPAAAHMNPDEVEF